MTPRKPRNPKPSPSPKAESNMTRSTTIHIPQDDRTRVVTLHIYEAERKRWVAALDKVTYGILDAANVFALIQESLSMGSLSRGDAGLISLANICAGHFKTMAETEGEFLSKLEMTLHHAQIPQEEKEEP